MKKTFLFFVLTFMLSCSVNDDSVNSHFEILPIESAIVPDEFIFGNSYGISLTYLRPSTCHTFSNIYFASDLNEHTVAVINEVFLNNTCEDTSQELETSFNFQVTTEGFITFKFWQGTDENDEDQYLIIEVPVIN